MAWGRLDDRFHEHKKTRRLWKACPAAVGLFAMAITYCAGNETDGYVDALWLEERCQFAGALDAPDALVEAGFIERVDDETWLIPSFLEFHPSRAQAEERRAADAERKARGRQSQKAARSTPDTRRRPDDDGPESAQRPNGHDPDSGGTGGGVGRPSSGPDPTRPDPTRPVSPNGETTTARDAPDDVVVVPPPVAVRPEIDAACDTLAAVSLHVHDRTTVQRLADDHPEVDIAQAAINCARWYRSGPGGRRKARHPLSALTPFVTDEHAPGRQAPPGDAGGRVDHYAAMAAQHDQETHA